MGVRDNDRDHIVARVNIQCHAFVLICWLFCI